MPTERIAQTFPDIDSQGLNTSGTAAGVRSFPQPFVGGGSSGVDILIQSDVIVLPIGTLSGSVALGTPVDIAKSFIQYRGVNISGSSIFINEWRNRLTFTNFAGSIASDVTATRRNSTTAASIYFTTVTFGGAGGTSADIRISNISGEISPPIVGQSIIAFSPELTASELARATVFTRGIEFKRIPGGASACRAGTGTECQRHIEQCHGSVEMRNSFGNTIVTFVRFTAGSTFGTDHCGSSTVDCYFTVVVWP